MKIKCICVGYKNPDCSKCFPPTIETGYCPKREDGTHCEHWWDGEKCHSCGHNPIPE